MKATKGILILGIALVMAACAKPVPMEGAWLDNYDQATKQAEKDGKMIFALFTGSDWCPFCTKLTEEVLNTQKFKDYSSEKFVFFVADFPRNTELDEKTVDQNAKLVEQFGVQGFPTVFILDSKGKVLGRTGYRPGGAEKYIEHLQSLIDASKVEAKTPLKTT